MADQNWLTLFKYLSYQSPAKMTQVVNFIKTELVNLGITSLLKDKMDDIAFYHVSSWELLEKQLAAVSADLLILDSSLCDIASVANFEKVRRKYPLLKMILLAEEDKTPIALAIIKKGIGGVCMKSISEHDFMQAYSMVMSGKKYLDPTIAEYLLSGLAEHNRIDLLTPRQSQISNLLVEGLRTADIAKKLDIAVSTVSTIKHNIFKKMSVDNVVDLANKVAGFRNSDKAETGQSNS